MRARFPRHAHAREHGPCISLRVTVAAPPPDLLWPEPHFGPLIGQSEPMRKLFAMLARVAATDIPVFICGETGSGKELVARAVHEASPRAKGPYIVVDCAALAENQLESELFGHARDGFTGGATCKRDGGAIEAADGGTVFLDEIGELPLEMQPKLLRVLERPVRRVGESEQPVDVRFIAATHRDLVDFVARGWFREDLYFRLAVLPLRVPPLREHMDDLEPLIRHFLGPAANALITPALLSELGSRTWRGNIRELRNVLDRVRAFGVDRTFSREPLMRDVEPGQPVMVPPALLDLRHREFRDRWAEIGERVYLERKLAKHSGNVSKVSREIELARTYTHKLIKKHGL